MEKAFLHFIESYKLFTNKHKLLLAFSGGKDSVCLFHLLYKTGFNFHVAHCNFNLRGEESNVDQAFSKSLAETHNIPFHLKEFDTQKLKAESGLSTQEMARKLRYDWFFELKNKLAFDFILTAHHLSDNSETFFINIFRNTGISGLHGIPINNNQILRPLMFASSNQIVEYLNQNNCSYREDSSNKKQDYLRNKIRHSLMPVLEKIEPEIDKKVFELNQKVLHFEALSLHLIKEKWAQVCLLHEDGFLIKLDELKNLPHPELFLYFNLKQNGFNMAQIASFCLEENNIGAKIESQTHQISKERDGFFVKEISEQSDLNLVFNNLDEIALYANEFFEFKVTLSVANFEKNRLYIDVQSLVFPLSIRTWRHGDKIKPFGMNGTKKVSDVLTDKKISNHLRASVLVLENADHTILSVLPFLQSEQTKLRNHSDKVLMILTKELSLKNN